MSKSKKSTTENSVEVSKAVSPEVYAKEDTYRYQIKKGILETKLFKAGQAVPKGWFDDKYKAGYVKPKAE